jgi:putative inorganic carbon (hco3(-)) transporter
MMSLIVIGLFLCLLPFAFRFPMLGLCIYVWLDYVAPERLFMGPYSDDARLSLLTGVVSILGYIFFEKKTSPGPSVAFKAFILLSIWVTITSVFAVYPDSGWLKWERFAKNVLMITLAVLLIDSRERLMMFMGAVLSATTLLAVKGAWVTIVTGGGGLSVVGTVGTYLEERNYVAIAFLMSFFLGASFCVWAQKTKQSRNLVWVLGGMAALSLISALGTHSRAAALALGVSLVAWAAISKHKTAGLAALPFVFIALLVFAPEQLVNRVSTINDYQEDYAATSRLDTWLFAWNYALNHPIFGGGYTIFRQNFQAGAATGIFDAHSVYFEILAEHGFVGVAIFLTIVVSVVVSLLQSIKKLTEKNDPMRFHAIGALAGAVAMFTAGFFAVLSPFFMTYVPLVITAAIIKILKLESNKVRS